MNRFYFILPIIFILSWINILSAAPTVSNKNNAHTIAGEKVTGFCSPNIFGGTYFLINSGAVIISSIVSSMQLYVNNPTERWSRIGKTIVLEFAITDLAQLVFSAVYFNQCSDTISIQTGNCSISNK